MSDHIQVDPEELDLNPASTLAFPFVPLASGRYKWTQFLLQTPAQPASTAELPAEILDQPEIKDEDAAEQGARETAAFFPWWWQREDLRLDIDGRYPQKTLSGTRYAGFSRVHWIASLSGSDNYWFGPIWYKDGNTTAFPYTYVRVWVTRSWFAHQRRVRVRFYGSGVVSATRSYYFRSYYFHPVEFEYDRAQGTDAVTTVQTHAHPNRPASLPDETLSLEKAFERAGFKVRKSGGDDVVPLSLSGANQRWSDSEMHDAMQAYWSRFSNSAQWSMWVFFASLSESGTSLGGIMFDDIGPNHRQGTAIFEDSFIKNPPAGDPAPAAWVQRMRFWTAAHEMGHSFNLAHSWQKALVYQGHGPWIPLPDEPEARSFMNYPYFVAGGQQSFFSDFEYRFSDGELLFMRHAPARFVQMGNADWFDHHGFEQAETAVATGLKLELRTHRSGAVFEFLEPPILELKLTNVSSEPRLISEQLLTGRDDVTIIVKKDGKPAREFVPYAERCFAPSTRSLAPRRSVYEPVSPFAGLNGLDLAEPGYYTVQVCLHVDGGDVLSNPLRLRITPPKGYDEEYVAQDFLTGDVGRVLALGGSRFLEGANDTLREVCDKLPDSRAALHARVALAGPDMTDYKLLRFPDEVADDLSALRSASESGGAIQVVKADFDSARRGLESSLFDDADQAAESLGHIGYKSCIDRMTGMLAKAGDRKRAARAQGRLLSTLTQRGVLGSVLRNIERRRDRYRK